MEAKKNTRTTKLSKWVDSATDAQWEELTQDIDQYSGMDGGDKKFAEKYGFSIPGVKPYLEMYRFEIATKAKYEQKLKEALENKGQSIPELKYKKPETPYKKVTLTLTEEAYKTLMETADKLSEEYGYEKRYCTSAIVMDGCKRFEGGV